MVDRRDSEERLIVRLLVRCDALHFTESVCDDFCNDTGIFRVEYLKK